MNKKIIIAGIAIVSMTAIITQQANASMDKNNENRGKMEQQKEQRHAWSGDMMGSGDKKHLGSGRNEMWSGLKLWSGEKKHFGSGDMMWSGEKERLGSWFKLGSGFHFGSGGNIMWSGEKKDLW